MNLNSALGWNGAKDLPAIVESYLKGDVKADEFVTSEMLLKDINEAFELLKKGEGLVGSRGRGRGRRGARDT